MLDLVPRDRVLRDRVPHHTRFLTMTEKTLITYGMPVAALTTAMTPMERNALSSSMYETALGTLCTPPSARFQIPELRTVAGVSSSCWRRLCCCVQSLPLEVPQQRTQLGSMVQQTLPGLTSCESYPENNIASHGGDLELPFYISLQTVWKALQGRDVLLIRASWLIELARRDGRMPRRQELPPAAIWDVDDFKKFLKDVRWGQLHLVGAAGAGRSGCQGPAAFATLPIVTVSYCWLTREHPDPKSQTIRALSRILEKYLEHIQRILDKTGVDASSQPADVAVFMDFLSVYQRPRTQEEQAAFERATRDMHVWYGHTLIPAWLITKQPPEWEDDPDTVKYNMRGWTTFERTVSSLTKPHAHVLDLGKLSWLYTGGHGSQGDFLDVLTSLDSLTKREPPVDFGRFKKLINTKIFTDSHDKETVTEEYRRFARVAMAGCERQNFRGMMWGEKQAKALALVLPQFSLLTILELSNNQLGDGKDDTAIRHLAEALPKCPSLGAVILETNTIRDSGAVWLARAIPHCRMLERLDLKMNEIGDIGTDHLAGAIPRSATLKFLSLAHNRIGDRGAESLANGAEASGVLERLTLENNFIGPLGIGKLKECCGRRPSLTLAVENQGDPSLQRASC